MLFHSLVNLLCLLQIWTPVRCSWVGHFPILAQSMALWQSLIGAGIAYIVDSILRFLKYWGLFFSGCTRLQDNELWIISEQWQIDWSCLNIWTSINSSVAIPLWRSNWSWTGVSRFFAGMLLPLHWLMAIYKKWVHRVSQGIGHQTTAFLALSTKFASCLWGTQVLQVA
jgi:hypothetical protein